MRYLLFILLLMGCSSQKIAQRHLDKAKDHLAKAQKYDPSIKLVDTVTVTIPVYIPQVKTDTIFQSLEGDTITIIKDRLKIKYVNLPGDSVFIEGECKADTVFKEVKVPTPIYISTESYKDIVRRIFGFNNWQFWLFHVIIALFVAAYLINKFR